MNYFELAQQISRTSAVRDAEVTLKARKLMTEQRQSLVQETLETECAYELADLLNKLLYGTPSVKAEARLAWTMRVENTANARARGESSPTWYGESA